MKKVRVLYYFMFAVLVFFFDSCKPKHDHDQNGMKEMKHFYKVFNGKINSEDATRSNADLIFNYITFNDSIRKYFKNTSNNLLFKLGSDVKVYQYVRDLKSNLDFDKKVLGKDTVIVLINDVLLNNMEDESQKDIRKMMGRGNMGCIPKFEQNASNNLFFFEEGGNRYVPLMLADHKSAKKDIVHYLTNFNFKISEDNYDVLNYIYKKDKFIEGGLDTINKVVYLNIYKSGGNFPYLKIEEIK